jgi:hypothetical protein
VPPFHFPSDISQRQNDHNERNVEDVQKDGGDAHVANDFKKRDIFVGASAEPSSSGSWRSKTVVDLAVAAVASQQRKPGHGNKWKSTYKENKKQPSKVTLERFISSAPPFCLFSCVGAAAGLCCVVGNKMRAL